MSNSKTYFVSFLALGVLCAAPAFAGYNCDEHAAHIDHGIGAEYALDAYHVLHGDKDDDHHIIDKLKSEHADIEKELEEYVAHGCGIAELEAHAHDPESEAADAAHH